MKIWRCWSGCRRIVRTEADDHLTVTFAGWDLPEYERPIFGRSAVP